MTGTLDFSEIDPEALKDPELQELLADYDEILTANPLVGYLPHEKQRRFHAFRGPMKVFLGGNRTGKSTGGINDDLIQAIDEDAVPDHLKQYKKWQPPFHCRIVTPDFKRTMKAVQEAIRRWCPRDQLKGGSWEKAYSKADYILEFQNGSFFEFMTYEQDLDKFGGSARHRIHYDEEPPGEKGEDVRKECLARLIDYNGDEIFTFTPLLGLTWTFDEIEDGKGPEIAPNVWQDDNMCVVRVDMEENPHLSAEARDRILEKYSETQRKARKEGNFIHFQGLVYPEFDWNRHTCDRVDPDHVAGQSIQIVIDPGIRNTAVTFWAFDRDNHMLEFDELLLEDSTPEKTVNAIRDKEEFWGIKGRRPRPMYLIDPAARNRSLTDGKSVENLFQEAGLPVMAAQNDVEAGIFEVKRRFERNLITIARNCVETLKERQRYRIKQTPDGSFAVVKRNDHLMDTKRYAAMSRPLFPVSNRNRRRKGWTPGFAPPADFRPPDPDLGPMGAMS